MGFAGYVRGQLDKAQKVWHPKGGKQSPPLVAHWILTRMRTRLGVYNVPGVLKTSSGRFSVRY